MGWKRKGLLEPVYEKLREEGVKHPVKELAERTGLPPGNLSMINSGKRDMTDNYAVAISAKVPGISPQELGSDVGEDVSRSLLILDRLQSLEDDLKKERRDRAKERTALAGELAVLRAALGIEAPQQTPRKKAAEGRA